MKAIIYIAHGSRRKAANEKFVVFIKSVMDKCMAPIQAFGFFEHAEPSLEQAIESCILEGADEITVVPVFLLPGIHVNEDIPAAFSKYPSVTFHYGKPLGADEMMVEILHDRLAEARFSAQEDEVVLLVGHGSRDPEAKREFEKLASRLNVEAYTAYLTTSVFYHDMIEKLVGKKIYLLPHLLFTGGYVTKMEESLLGYGERIVFCRPIGFDGKLISLIEKRASEVFKNERQISDYVKA
jgi:sirohydrochlorin ferrochelatase